MPRKTPKYTDNSPLPQRPMPVSTRTSSTSPAASRPGSPRSVQTEMLGKPSQSMHSRKPLPNSSGDSVTTESNPAGSLVGKQAGKSGKKPGASIQDEEDADEDDDKAAVNRPARSNPNPKPLLSAKQHLAGRVKRSFDAIGRSPSPASLEEVPDYPRKKISRRISTTSEGMLAYHPSPSPLGCTNDDAMTGHEEAIVSDDDDDDVDVDDADELERELEREEEAAIIREVEADGSLDDPMQSLEVTADENVFTGIDASMLNDQALEDLDNELFHSQWTDPHRFDDLNLFDISHLQSDTDNDLFSVHPTPGTTPRPTPRASVSTTYNVNSIPAYKSDDNDDDDDDDEESEISTPDLTPYFNRNNVAGNQTGADYRGSGTEDTDDDAGLLKYFFSSGSEDEISDEDEATDSEPEIPWQEGETTDEEENLPMPTPQSKSRLRRTSVSPEGVRQLVAEGGEDSNPTLYSWACEPDKPIVVIEGTKQTYLIPRKVNGRNSTSSIPESDVLYDTQVFGPNESESEKSVLGSFDPALPGLSGMSGSGVLSGSDLIGPPEAFISNFNIDDIFNEADPMDDGSMDPYEANLELSDFLDISTEDDGEKGVGQDTDVDDILAELDGKAGQEEGEECAPRVDSSDMLSIWDKVSVTAFRKRQVQHSQKLAAMHAGHTPESHKYGYHRGKDAHLSETITPTKRRKVRQKFLSNHRGLPARATKLAHR